MNKGIQYLLIMILCLLALGIAQTSVWVADQKIEKLQTDIEDLRFEIGDLQKDYENLINPARILFEAKNRETLQMVPLEKTQQTEVYYFEFSE